MSFSAEDIEEACWLWTALGRALYCACAAHEHDGVSCRCAVRITVGMHEAAKSFRALSPTAQAVMRASWEAGRSAARDRQHVLRRKASLAALRRIALDCEHELSRLEPLRATQPRMYQHALTDAAHWAAKLHAREADNDNGRTE